MPTAPAQQAYNAREKNAYHAFVNVRGPVKGGQKGFRKLMRERGWKIPPAHGQIGKQPSAREEAQRKFVAEGLDRPERAERDAFDIVYR